MRTFSTLAFVLLVGCSYQGTVQQYKADYENAYCEAITDCCPSTYRGSWGFSYDSCSVLVRDNIDAWDCRGRELDPVRAQSCLSALKSPSRCGGECTDFIDNVMPDCSMDYSDIEAVWYCPPATPSE